VTSKNIGAKALIKSDPKLTKFLDASGAFAKFLGVAPGWLQEFGTIDPEVARRPKTILLGHWVRDWLMWVIAPMERGFVSRSGTSPTSTSASSCLASNTPRTRDRTPTYEKRGLRDTRCGSRDSKTSG